MILLYNLKKTYRYTTTSTSIRTSNNFRNIARWYFGYWLAHVMVWVYPLWTSLESYGTDGISKDVYDKIGTIPPFQLGYLFRRPTRWSSCLLNFWVVRWVTRLNSLQINNFIYRGSRLVQILGPGKNRASGYYKANFH